MGCGHVDVLPPEHRLPDVQRGLERVHTERTLKRDTEKHIGK